MATEIHVVNLDGDRLDFQTVVDATVPDRPSDIATVMSIAGEGRFTYLALTGQQRLALIAALGGVEADDRVVDALEILREAAVPPPPVPTDVSIDAAIQVLEGPKT